MAKQLLIYQDPVPVSKTRHRSLSIKSDDSFAFVHELNASPITAVEFPPAAREFTIVFTGKGRTLSPAVILGFKQGENLFIGKDGAFTAKYVPAFFRRYPFVFSSADDGENLTLCFDQSFKGCNQDGQGERLFDSEGKHTLYLKHVLGFLNEYRKQHLRTKALGKKLEEFDLLVTRQALIRHADGQRTRLSGFSIVSRKKLKALSPKLIESLFKTDELELIYLHLQSLRNFGTLIEKLPAR